MTNPRVTILLLTYSSTATGPRAKYAQKTLRSALDNLVYEDGYFSVHIADDGSPAKHIENLKDIAGGYPSVRGISTTNAARRGYGASYNLATQIVHQNADIIIPLEDDWELRQRLDLTPYVMCLASPAPIDCIRLGYLGYTQALRGELGLCAGKQYLLFDPDSPERHVCAGHPRIETVDFERRVGPWPEGIDPGTTEHVWCGFPAARQGVTWPMDSPQGGWFAHIGSVQAREDQKAEAVAV